MSERPLATPSSRALDSQDALDTAVEVYERERAAVAGDLHDGPIQVLTAASLRLQSAAHFGELTPELAEEVAASIAVAAGQLRQVMTNLATWWIAGTDLDDAIERYVLQRCAQHRVEATCELEPLGPLATKHAAAVFRVIQEAVANALHHSGTDRLVVRLSTVSGEVVLEVLDFGSGFAPEAVDSAEQNGLELMRKRVESVGGLLTVTRGLGAGAGTTVRAVIPVAR
jgi:signal transduction histidine kinase